MAESKPAPLVIAGQAVAPGEHRAVEIALPALYTSTPVIMRAQVIRGRRPGPSLFVSAALHGDEINGVEIIRRLIRAPAMKQLRGSLIAVPIVNGYGFVRLSRYLPDRRDLNRSFPGSETGSLAARLADTFLREVVTPADYGIDLHTGAVHRENLPQIRASLDDQGRIEQLAKAFGSPVILNADMRDGSLREAASTRGVPVLVFEGGEALRFDELVIRAGLRGVIGVLRHLGMVRPGRAVIRQPPEPVVARSSVWVRAPQSGILRAIRPLGACVAKGETLGWISDPLGDDETPVESPSNGIIIGKLNLPLVNEGEALYHIARFSQPGNAAAAVEQFQESLAPDGDGPDSAEPSIS